MLVKNVGIVQGFWSLNPRPTQGELFTESLKKGFQTIFEIEQLIENCQALIDDELNFFSSMLSKRELGSIIQIASQQNTNIAKAEKFLELIRK
jgi:hypothetical protein